MRPPFITTFFFVFFVSFVPFVSAQTLTQRGFIDGTAFRFPQQAPDDSTRAVGDLLVREELFFKPLPWMQFAGGLDLPGQLPRSGRRSVASRLQRSRPEAAPRVDPPADRHVHARTGFTLDAGKQFIRWGKADIVNPTDRFAPRDFINVVDAEFLAVTGIHGVVETGAETFELVWVPRFTPSRVPLPDQRWTVVPTEVSSIPPSTRPRRCRRARRPESAGATSAPASDTRCRSSTDSIIFRTSMPRRHFPPSLDGPAMWGAPRARSFRRRS